MAQKDTVSSAIMPFIKRISIMISNMIMVRICCWLLKTKEGKRGSFLIHQFPVPVFNVVQYGNEKSNIEVVETTNVGDNECYT